jgi:hypothetical protein
MHRSCYKRIYREYTKQNQADDVEDMSISISEHDVAYGAIKTIVHERVLRNKEMLSLVYLRDQFRDELNRQGSPNWDYRSSKLKGKLSMDKDLAELIDFCLVCILYA